MLGLDAARPQTVNALWWRIPAWAAIIGASVAAAHGVVPRVATGALMVVGVVAFQFIRADAAPVRIASLLITTITGLAACVTAPDGIAEVLVVVAAGRATNAFDAMALRWFVVLDTVAFAATVGYISHSVAGLLAGTGIPLLVQRSIEHRDLIRERDRAQALLAEAQSARESEAQAAALRERGRIAREMHDVLAHSLAGLSMHLQGARAVAAREQVPASVLEPLDKAAQLAREGLTEARAAVGALRDPVGIGLDALPTLIARHPGQARLTTTGEGTVSAEVGHAVYRAVQEALTNAARYAPGSPVVVTLEWRGAVLAVSVDDSGPGPGRVPVAGQGSGLGLTGMAERITQVDGTLHAGPEPSGGWRIAIEVPAVSEPAAVTP